eukprot:evm.model.scf_1518.4 EVM.evm.TU.scf_1518.4   scf_1518:22440-34055(-)
MTREVMDGADNGPLVNGGPEAMEGVEDARDGGASASGATTSSDWSGEYTWSIPNVSSLKDRKLYSERFEIGTYSWRLLVFPRGNDNARQPDHIAVYLDFPEAPYTPPHMCPKAHFELVVENQLHPEKTLSRETHHSFTSQATDWGFTQFLPFSDANDPKKGFVIDDTLVLKVKITVQRDERYSYASRKETGYVGLKNQGATCYMNSLLQYLYHLPYFRKAVYHMPTLETDEPERSLPLALQSLFFKLQHSPTSVSTKALTKSFGWGTYDAFMQHDVQEMEAKLCEKLEEKMKGTKVEKVIQYLFVGHYSSHIDCIDVDFKSITQQPFMEIQLEVTGCRDIYASLDKFCEEERLDGQNKYQAEGHGLVDARKYVKFDDFPPVLQLHLKRFDYDYQRDLQIKINDHYEFYSTLDLDIENRKYLTENSDRSVRNLYKLHSVLVHSGGPHGGHYFAYIRPADKWYKFDDEMVQEETEKRAIHDQFGGDDEPVQPTMTTYNTPGLKYAKQSTAYMLVYIRESDWDNISCPCKKEEIAEHIRTRLEEEGFRLELLKTMTYDNVCSELAQHLGLDDPRKLRLTQHNMYAHQPHRNPIKYRGVDSLEAMIVHVRHYTNILYYEILDMPLPELEKLKCLRVQFHNEKCECIGEHQVRLPKDKFVADLLGELRKELGEEYEGKPMRLMEVYHGKIFKVLKYDTTLDTLNENYWQYRAEVIPEDERELHPGEHNLHVCHFRTDDNSNGIATTFGDPFWLRIRQGETLADVKPRIQDKLGVPGDEFAKWKFAFSARQMHHPLEYLDDGDDVLSKFPRLPLFSQNSCRYYGGEYCFLGLEHEDTRPRRPAQHSRYTYERPVRIYS